MSGLTDRCYCLVIAISNGKPQYLRVDILLFNLINISANSQSDKQLRTFSLLTKLGTAASGEIVQLRGIISIDNEHTRNRERLLKANEGNYLFQRDLTKPTPLIDR